MSDFVLLQGKGKWIKLTRPNMYGKYSLDLYMNNENIEKFKTLNVKNHIKKDEDGYYVSFSRATDRTIKGKVVALPPPIILDKDNIPTVTGAIGNGSDLTVKLEHYGYTSPQTKKKEFACRIHAVRIDNLVPYDETSIKDERELEDVKDFKNKPIAF